jgi:hypothetical protein
VRASAPGRNVDARTAECGDTDTIQLRRGRRTLAKKKVHQFKKWHDERGENVVLKGTREHIEEVKGVIIEGTEEEVDEADLDATGSYKPAANRSRK